MNRKVNKCNPNTRWSGDISTFSQRVLPRCGSIFVENLLYMSDDGLNIYRLGLKENTLEIRMPKTFVSRNICLRFSLIPGTMCFFVMLYKF